VVGERRSLADSEWLRAINSNGMEAPPPGNTEPAFAQ